MRKTIVFRTDASSTIGVGHIMRCLTLANQLTSVLQCEIYFIVNAEFPIPLETELMSYGYTVYRLPQTHTFNWEIDAEASISFIKRLESLHMLVVDHYGISENWEKRLRPFCSSLMVIDDLANRKHDCDILLDQNIRTDETNRYANLVPKSCLLLIGPSYALLRPEFTEFQKLTYSPSYPLRVLVNFGGSDPTNETLKVLQALAIIQLRGIQLDATVVAGISNRQALEIERFCNDRNGFSYTHSTTQMGYLLQNADLAIGAGGISILERVSIGVPSVVICVADNQIEAISQGERLGIHHCVGSSAEVTLDKLTETLTHMIKNDSLRYGMFSACVKYRNEHFKYSVAESLLEVLTKET